MKKRQRDRAGKAAALPVRATVALALVGVLRDGRSLSALCGPTGLLGGLPANTRPHAVAMVYGSLRHWSRLKARVLEHLSRPLRAKDMDILTLLVASTFELEDMHTPAHAVVHEAVAATRALGKPWASGLTNAVLRRLTDTPRTSPEMPANTADMALATSHPTWLVEQLRADYPEDAARILDANNAPAPMTLRVNLALSSREEYLACLDAADIRAEAGSIARSAVILAAPMDIERLPGFRAGVVSVQDEAAQLSAALASHCLEKIPKPRILDACAAPGGKTLALAEQCPDAYVDALEIDTDRANRIWENLARMPDDLRERVAVKIGDARSFSDEAPYDLILADVPCSGTGVIRRHPDIKWLRRPEDVEALTRLQREIVHALWPLLKRNGILIYATCSVLACENHQQIEQLLSELPGSQQLPMPSSLSLPVQDPEPRSQGAPKATEMLQILPGQSGMDGFFYAMLQKATQPMRPLG